MARPVWSGSISFGLVNVPVKLFTALSQKEVRFHMLHEPDGARIKQRRFCSAEEQEVPWEEIVKGYEISRGRYVKVTPEELESLDPRATRTIDIIDFVDASDIDPLYYDSTYHVVPDTGAGKAWALLHEAMERQGKVAIARFVMRTRQHLCALRVMGQGLALTTMQYHDEVVPVEDVATLPDLERVGARELDMAERLVESLSAKFEPDRYKDEYRERVLELIEAKARGKEITAPPPAEEPEVVDILEALRRSLEQRGAGGERRQERVSRTAERKESAATGAKSKTKTRARSKSASRTRAKKAS